MDLNDKRSVILGGKDTITAMEIFKNHAYVPKALSTCFKHGLLIDPICGFNTLTVHSI
jgi:hypothetical protein